MITKLETEGIIPIITVCSIVCKGRQKQLGRDIAEDARAVLEVKPEVPST